MIERRGDDGWVEQWVFGATGARMIRGTASTPRKNAHGQFLNSMGCKAELPVPLFIEHRREEPPVGEVVALRRSWASVTFEARLHRTAEADARIAALRSGLEAEAAEVTYLTAAFEERVADFATEAETMSQHRWADPADTGTPVNGLGR